MARTTKIRHCELFDTTPVSHLKAVPDGVQLLLGDLGVSPDHVGRLFGVERVRDTSHHEHVELHAPASLILLAFRPLQVRLAPVHARQRRRRRTGRARRDHHAAAAAGGVEHVAAAAAARRSRQTHVVAAAAAAAPAHRRQAALVDVARRTALRPGRRCRGGGAGCGRWRRVRFVIDHDRPRSQRSAGGRDGSGSGSGSDVVVRLFARRRL